MTSTIEVIRKISELMRTRPHEVKQILNGPDLSSCSDLRRFSMEKLSSFSQEISETDSSYMPVECTGSGEFSSAQDKASGDGFNSPSPVVATVLATVGSDSQNFPFRDDAEQTPCFSDESIDLWTGEGIELESKTVSIIHEETIGLSKGDASFSIRNDYVSFDMRKEISQKRKHWNIDKLARGKISRTRDNSQGSNENAIDYHASRSLNVNSDESSEMDVNNKKSSQRKAFVVRVKTKNLNLDDGFKWLKYGEKELRNHRYTRSYYKCEKSRVRRCPVQKWITVSSENSDYVDFAYIGIHNHRPNC